MLESGAGAGAWNTRREDVEENEAYGEFDVDTVMAVEAARLVSELEAVSTDAWWGDEEGAVYVYVDGARDDGRSSMSKQTAVSEAARGEEEGQGQDQDQDQDQGRDGGELVRGKEGPHSHVYQPTVVVPGPSPRADAAATGSGQSSDDRGAATDTSDLDLGQDHGQDHQRVVFDTDAVEQSPTEERAVKFIVTALVVILFLLERVVRTVGPLVTDRGVRAQQRVIAALEPAPRQQASSATQRWRLLSTLESTSDLVTLDP